MVKSREWWVGRGKGRATMCSILQVCALFPLRLINCAVTWRCYPCRGRSALSAGGKRQEAGGGEAEGFGKRETANGKLGDGEEWSSRCSACIRFGRLQWLLALASCCCGQTVIRSVACNSKSSSSNSTSSSNSSSSSTADSWATSLNLLVGLRERGKARMVNGAGDGWGWVGMGLGTAPEAGAGDGAMASQTVHA